MIDVVITCVKILQQLYQIRKEMIDNWADCQSLLERCHIFDEILNSYEDVKTWSQEVSLALQNLQKVLEDVHSFAVCYTKRTYFNGVTRLAFRQTYASKLAGHHQDIDRAAGMFHLNLTVSLEARRQQDMMDAKATFQMLVDKVSHDIAERGEDTKEELQQLRVDIREFAESLNSQMQLLRHAPITTSEMSVLQREMEELSGVLEQRHREIVAGLGRIEQGMDLVLDLLRDKQLTNEAEKKRTERLDALKLSRAFIKFPNALKTLGQGGFGVVHVASMQNRVVAVKSISAAALHTLSGDVRNAAKEFSAKQVRAIENEVLLTDYVRGPGVVSLFGYVADPREVMVVFELAQYGSLEQVLSNQAVAAQKLISLALQLAWLCDLAAALEHIHRKKIKHLDVKPHNLLVYGGLHLKLSDFGLAKEHHSNMHGAASNSASRAGGTMMYMAPEIRNGLSSQYSSDIFSFAMTAAHIMTGRAPLVPDSGGQVRRAVQSAVRSESERSADFASRAERVEEQLTKYLLRCTQWNDQMHADVLRPTASQLYVELSTMLESLDGDPRGMLGEMGGSREVEVIEQVLSGKIGVTEASASPPAHPAHSSPASTVHAGNSSATAPSSSLSAGPALGAGFRALESLTPEEAIQWAKHLRLPPYVQERFADNIVDGEMLSSMDDVKEFTEFDVKIAHAKVLLKAIATAKSKGVPQSMLEAASLSVSEPQAVSAEAAASHVEDAEETAAVIPAASSAAAAAVDGDRGGITSVSDAVSDAESAVVTATMTIAATPAQHASQWAQAYEQFSKAGYLRNADAVRWLEQQAADGNDAAKAYLMVYLFESDKDLPRADDMGEELQRETLPRWLQSTDATEQMHAEYIMGYCYYCGLGCDEDDKQALSWYRMAADQGHAQAQYQLGQCYHYGNGVSQDYEQAVSWYRMAAYQGHAGAQYELGKCFYCGWGVSEDYEQAVSWYRMAADQGHAQAQYLLGECYYCGWGVSKDKEQAVPWYRKAADRGHAEAQYKLGQCYLDGEGVPADRDQAIAWCRKAAAQGDRDAISQLEEMNVSLT